MRTQELPGGACVALLGEFQLQAAVIVEFLCTGASNLFMKDSFEKQNRDRIAVFVLKPALSLPLPGCPIVWQDYNFTGVSQEVIAGPG